jgi:membrane-associated phospholipid phosphatase
VSDPARTPVLVPERGLLRAAAIACAIMLAAIVVVDRPLARFIAGHETGEPTWSNVLGYVEYAIGITPWPWTGVTLLVAGVVITRVMPRWRYQTPAWMFVALVHLLSRNLTMWIKALTGRIRPGAWLAHPGDTFLRVDGWTDLGLPSFPSGHVTLVASLAVPIAVLEPRLRWPMFVVIAFVMAARVAANAHFVGDVVGGVALVCAVSWLCARVVKPLTAPR